MTVRVEARPGTGPGQREAAAESVGRAVKDGIGLTVEVAVVEPDTLERSVGKIRRVADERSGR